MAVDLSGLGTHGFERLSQALALKVLGPSVRVFGAGPDGGREADFQGRLTFPNADDPWDGYGVLQAKFKERITTTGHDTAWFIGRVKAEMDAWVDSNRRRVQDGRLPEYLIFSTNVWLSAVPRTGGKDRVDDLIRKYRAQLPLKDWQVWDADQIITLLDCHPDVRRSFAAMITPNEVLAAIHDGLTAPRQTNLVVEMPSNRIRPGQPGNEGAFQPLYDSVGGARRLGEALSEAVEYGPGFVQHFDGGLSGEPAVLCAPFRRPVIAVAQPVWNDLCAVGAGAVNGGVEGIGYPDPAQPGHPYLGLDIQAVELVGGEWGRPVNGIRRGRLLRQPGRPTRWEPEIVYDSEASRDRDTWTNRSAKMDLRLCAAARIPLVADDLRVTEAGRARMLTALASTTADDLLGSLATRYGLDPAFSWQETAEPEGRNDRRAAAYQAVIPGKGGRPAIRASLWLMLPASYSPEVAALMDMRVDFTAIRPDAEPPVPADLKVSYRELVRFFELAWQVTTSVLLLAAAEEPLEVPPAGAPRLEFYVQNERPPASGDTRVCRTLDMVDLAALGRARTEIRDLAVAVTAPLCLPKHRISQLVGQALQRIGEDFGFAGTW